MRNIGWFTLGILLAASGCTTIPECCGVHTQSSMVRDDLKPLESPPAYADVRKRLGTRRDYHAVAITPGDLLSSLDPGTGNAAPRTTIDMPIYLVGVEKVRGSDMPRHVDPTSCSGHGYRVASWLPKDDESPTREGRLHDAACSELSHRRPNLLTHIARFDGLKDGRYQSPCLLFSLYPGGERCSGTGASGLGSGYSYEEATVAIGALGEELRSVVAARAPTHILVLSTGWNTQQDESLFNYRDWLDAISEAAINDGVAFKPLVVAFSWESGWDVFFFRSMGAMTKGNDADEIGMTWANRIVNDLVRPIAEENGLPVVLVGHSYGTRVLGTSLVSAPLLEARSPAVQQTLRDLPVTFVALQPAFPIRRFHASKGKEPYFSRINQHNLLMVMTASRRDRANSVLDPIAPYAGGARAIRMIGKKDDTFPFIGSGHMDGTGNPSTPIPPRGVLLYDATPMVACNMPDTGGGAHSDVFDRATGTFIWRALRAGAGEPPSSGVSVRP